MPVQRRVLLSSSDGYDPKVQGVTQGLLARFLACRYQAKHAIAMWSGTGTRAALLYGDLVHAALAELHTMGEEIHEGPGCPENIDVVVEAQAKYLRQERGDRWSAEDHEDFELVQSQAHGVLRAYFQHYAKRNQKMTVLAAESEFDFKVGPLGIRVRGKRDGILEFLSKGKRKPTVWLFETKTRGMNFDINLATTLARDLQTNIYLLSLVAEGYDPRGVLYNEVRRPGLRPLKGRGKDAVPETLPEYEARVEADALADTAKYFRRLEIAVGADQIAEFEKQFIALLAEFHEWWKSGMPGFQYGMPCIGKYGACPYIGLCFEGSSDGLRKRDTMFEELEY